MLNQTDLRKKIAELDELRAELLQQASAVDGVKALEDAQPKTKQGSKEHEALLATGYGMDKAEAVAIVKDVDTKGGDSKFPWPQYKKAQAFLAALKAKPQVISTRRPWRIRHHRSRVTTVA